MPIQRRVCQDAWAPYLTQANLLLMLSEACQALIDLDEQNWWHTPQGIVHHPFPSVRKG